MSAPAALSVSVRRMQPADLTAVHQIDQLSFEAPWSRSAFEYELLQNSLAHLWVAEAQGPTGEVQVLGAMVVWRVVDEAHIGTLAIHPAHRQRGVGHQLLITALRELRGLGAQSAVLEVRRSNTAAQNLYLGLGFEVVGVRPRYYQDNHEDALLMTLPSLGDVNYRGF